MRTLLLLPVLLLLAIPAALATQRVDGTGAVVLEDTTPPRVATLPVHADTGDHGETGETDADSGDAPRSGFGQVMSVLTGLLHDAAQREATGRGDGFALDNPAIEISVTPVEGQTSLLRASTRRHAAGQAPRGAREKQLAGGTPR